MNESQFMKAYDKRVRSYVHAQERFFDIREAILSNERFKEIRNKMIHRSCNDDEINEIKLLMREFRIEYTEFNIDYFKMR